MGWDAYATKDGQTLEIKWPESKKDEPAYLVDDEFREAFSEAHHSVLDHCYSVDSFLGLGGLDISCCGAVISRYLGIDVYGDPVSPEDLKKRWEMIHWPMVNSVLLPKSEFVPGSKKDQEMMHFWSAYFFIQTCLDKGLGLFFSY